MKKIKIGNKEILLVEVEDDGTDFEIGVNPKNGFPVLSWEYFEDDIDFKDLPPGSWRILGSGKADAIKESEWKEVVEEYPDKYGIKYFNYKEVSIYSTAKESGHSLLSLHNFNLSSTVVLVKNE